MVHPLLNKNVCNFDLRDKCNPKVLVSANASAEANSNVNANAKTQYRARAKIMANANVKANSNANANTNANVPPYEELMRVRHLEKRNPNCKRNL